MALGFSGRVDGGDIRNCRQENSPSGALRKVWLASIVVALLLSCSHGPDRRRSDAPSPPPSPSALPAAGALLKRSAQAMEQVASARFLLEVEGNVSGTAVQIRRIQGLVSRAGELDATTTLGEPGQEVQWQYRIKGGKTYLKTPGSDWVLLSPVQPFNVLRLFDPNVGVAHQLGTATGVSTEASESVDGITAYRVEAKGSPSVLQGMANLPPGQETVKATLWIAKDGYRLLKAAIHVPTAESTNGATVPTGEAVMTLSLSDFDIPMDVELPVG